jgi:5-oxoprolinase (ATP-hydrolysing)
VADGRWHVWIDRGGTFTDAIARAPDGRLHTAKLLSSDEAPVLAVQRILTAAGAWRPGDPLPPLGIRLGTTVATNALLERRGVRTLLVTNRGLGDLLAIGTQERPDLFSLAIEKAPPLHERAVEVAGRLAADGRILEGLDEAEARAALAAARAEGIEAVAIALAHAYRDPAQEEALAAWAAEAGFPFVVGSAEVAREMGLLARGETAAADAYLTPRLRAHVRALERALPGAQLRFMQSSGGLTEGGRFRGPAALLSGPAGGVVGAARVAREAGFGSAIAFDMGGTSTDVSLIENGETERGFETVVAGVRVRAPMLRIHTVAAGGGSLCRFDGIRLTVGPESAGADPGPLCYGSPRARALALTDVNLHLGRVRPERFPLPLVREPVEAALAALEEEVRAAGHPLDRDGLAAGFLEIACAHMAQAIQEVSVRRGVDPRDHALVGFGGAAGQHVCAVARQLGIRTVLLHPLAGLLSAFGIGVAAPSWDGLRDAGRLPLDPDGRAPAPVRAILEALEAEGRAALAAEGAPPEALVAEALLELRYRGADTALAVAWPADGDFARAFAEAHRARFGYVREGRPAEVHTARVRVRGPAGEGLAPRPPPPRRERAPPRRGRAWFPGLGWTDAPVLDREMLRAGERLDGPAILLEDTGTVVIDPGFRARVEAGGLLRLEDEGEPEASRVRRDLRRADPVRLEVFGSRFMSIAEQMGAVLRNTAVSTNIKERLDYSCAVFDAAGGLVANAPHIPVHLGAMGATVRAVHAAVADLGPGDAIVTNDPACGGSHLPDVTLVSPVFVAGALRFFVASRGHHADVGGKTPGSMPADSRTLDEEGVLLRPFPLVRGGRFEEARLRAALEGARHPARHPDDNVADLEATVAANRTGERLLAEMVAELGLEAVEVTMAQLQEAAAQKVAREIARLPQGEHAFADALDDGTPVAVRIHVRGDRMRIDFTGTGAASRGNLNAPRAVTEAAVIYVLRALVAERIPLNGGCLAPVELIVPAGSLLDPPPGAAVVGGNVETSQRVVDVLLGALGAAAASQGTMNNVAFGDARFAYYETLGGGAGAGADFDGASGVHTHMTNTRITDVEVLESRYPVVVRRFALRAGSGGAGHRHGGDGLVRELEFTAPVVVSLLTQRRTTQPFGLAGGAPGAAGRNLVLRAGGHEEVLPPLARTSLAAGERLRIETPGGGGYGAPSRLARTRGGS